MDLADRAAVVRGGPRERFFDEPDRAGYDRAAVRIEIHPEHPDPRKIQRAADALRAGEVIGYPTDTVYALGCDPHDRKSLDRLHRVKRMPANQPLALVCADLSQVAEYAQLDNQQFRLIRRVLPGPYCFILLATRGTPRVLHLPGRTVGVRVPASPIASALVRELGHPVISTTAAHHGDPPPLDAAEVAASFPRVEMILDGGPCLGQPSTVVDLSRGEIEIVREGAGPLDALEA
jgi:tRNA threonylcarbamoyl adenosine modification protein (Sua5/YciO/YrdC/YwlC family)